MRFTAACLMAAGDMALAASGIAVEGPALLGIPVDFNLFGLTLLDVALFRHHTLRVALTAA